jgi:hypothetical protein
MSSWIAGSSYTTSTVAAIRFSQGNFSPLQAYESIVTVP